LPWGESVYATVYATNFYGDSTVSDAGNGAVISTYPDSPVNLAEVYSQRSKSTLGLSWSDASFTGGIAVIDYRISVSVDSGEYTVLATGVASKFYTAENLNFGSTYSFKVEAKNSYGYS
jgi:hypothetical protein